MSDRTIENFPERIWLGVRPGTTQLLAFKDEDAAARWAADTDHEYRERLVIGPIDVPDLPIHVGVSVPATFALKLHELSIDEAAPQDFADSPVEEPAKEIPLISRRPGWRDPVA